VNRLVPDAACHSKEIMNKRLEKRHKRQVSRARARVIVQQHDLKMPNEVIAAGGANLHDRSGPSGSQELSQEEQTARDIRSTRADVKAGG
jgi:hypothetical protein